MFGTILSLVTPKTTGRSTKVTTVGRGTDGWLVLDNSGRVVTLYPANRGRDAMEKAGEIGGQVVRDF